MLHNAVVLYYQRTMGCTYTFSHTVSTNQSSVGEPLTWGFVLESCWTLETSWRMPRMDPSVVRAVQVDCVCVVYRFVLGGGRCGLTSEFITQWGTASLCFN